MLCILAFITFLILFPVLGFFPSYRKLFRESWSCVFKKITRQPCDVNLGEKLKNKAVAKLFKINPKLARFLDKTFAFWAFLFVAVNVWSLVATSLAGLNLLVYDTCDPVTGESCSLSGQACGIGTEQLDLATAFNENRLLEYATQPWQTLGQTLSLIPNRLKTWQAGDFVGPTPSYYQQKNGNPTALEIIDPGCKYCKKLYQEIKETKFYERYNLTYLIYPIPDTSNTYNGGYKFQASTEIAKYMEALKQFPLENSKLSGDWLLLDKIFTEDGLQDKFNIQYSQKEIPSRIEDILLQIGYKPDQINQIREKANSGEVANSLQKQREIVQNQIRTIRIPTIIFDGRRYDRVPDTKNLK